MTVDSRLHGLVNLVLLLSCLLLATALVLIIRQEPEVENSSRTVPQPARAASLSWRWFDGKTESTVAAPVAEPEEKLAEASIDAELLGVVVGPASAAATIRVRGAQEKVYQVGDQLQSGVEVLSITNSRVVLEERGRRVQLSLPKAEGTGITTTAPANSSAASLQQGFSMADLFDAVPVQLDDGAGTGMKLDGLSDDIKALTDVEDGDIVTHVGDNSIDELMANPAQWINYSTQTALPVTIIRDGRETTIYVNAFSLSARILPNISSELTQ